jgi:hypothetical protein
MKIALITKPGHADSGVGRYAENLAPALRAAGHEVILIYPVVPLPSWIVRFIKKLFHWDLNAFFYNYPIWISYPNADLYHFTSQNLGTLMVFHPPPGEVIITVHDIIPWVLKNDPDLNLYRNQIHKFFDRLSLVGIKHCPYIITDSDYSQHTLINALPGLKSHMKTIYLSAQ